MQETKPALKSNTVRTALVVFIFSIWGPLMVALGGILNAIGLHVDTTAWTTYGDDHLISQPEIIAMARDLFVAALSLLAIRFRKQATHAIEGLFKKKD